MGIQSFNYSSTSMAFASTSAAIGANMRLEDQSINDVQGYTQAELDAKVSAIYSEMTRRAEGHNIGYVMGECLRRCIEESFSSKDKENTNEKDCLELCSEEMTPECHVTEGTRGELLLLLRQTPFDSEEYRCLIEALHREEIKPKHPIDMLVDLPIEMQREIRQELVNYGVSPEQIQSAFTYSIYARIEFQREVRHELVEYKASPSIPAPGVTIEKLPFRFHNPINFVFLHCSIDIAKALAVRGANVDTVCFSCVPLPTQILMLEHYRENPGIRRKASRVLLHQAVCSDDVESAEKLLNLRISGPNERDFEKSLITIYQDPENLLVAIRRGNEAMIDLLLRHDAKSSDGRSILQIVAGNQQHDFLEKLLLTGKYSKTGSRYSQEEIRAALDEVSCGVVCKVFRAAVTLFSPEAYAEYDKIIKLLDLHLCLTRARDYMNDRIRFR